MKAVSIKVLTKKEIRQVDDLSSVMMREFAKALEIPAMLLLATFSAPFVNSCIEASRRFRAKREHYARMMRKRQGRKA